MSQRIVFLIDSFTGPWAGTERQLWYLLERIDRQRYEPHLILLRHSDFSLDEKSWPCPVQVIGIKKIASLKGLGGLVRLVSVMRALDARIVHAYFQDSSLLGPLAARLAGARFVAGRRDMGIWYTRSNLRLLRLAGSMVDCVIANSNAVSELVAHKENIPESRITVVYNGLDETESTGPQEAVLDNIIPRGAPVVGIVANLRSVKRHIDLIHAFAVIRDEVPAAQLVIVGEGELEDSLSQLALSEGVGSCTHFLGRVEYPVNIIRQFSVAVLCSESEGLSNALMECLHEGKPAVCTDVGGNPELVQDGVNGYLYPVGNKEMLAERIVRILKDNTLQKKMGEASVRSMKDMTMENMVESHMTVYDAVLHPSV